MLSFFIGSLLVIIAVAFFRDAYAIFKGNLTDKRGKPLWVYGVLRKNLPVAKDRSQALLLTLMVATMSIALGGIMVGSFLVQFLRR